MKLYQKADTTLLWQGSATPGDVCARLWDGRHGTSGGGSALDEARKDTPTEPWVQPWETARQRPMLAGPWTARVLPGYPCLPQGAWSRRSVCFRETDNRPCTAGGPVHLRCFVKKAGWEAPDGGRALQQHLQVPLWHVHVLRGGRMAVQSRPHSLPSREHSLRCLLDAVA